MELISPILCADRVVLFKKLYARLAEVESFHKLFELEIAPTSSKSVDLLLGPEIRI